MKRRHFAGMLFSVPAAAQAIRPRTPDYPVSAFGATGDGRTLETAALQRAIDACGAARGGAVVLAAGVYLSGTLELRSGVTLRFEPGARLLGSRDLAHYPARIPAYRSYTDNYTEKSLIYAERVTDVALEGAGVIDGQGASFSGPYKVRPYLLRFIECRGVTVSGVRLENSPMWVQHYLACEDVYLRGVTVRSRVNQNNDGIDIDSCARVRISDCDISSGDDALCLKSTSASPCRDVVIANCVLSSACNAIKMGTESNGGFQNVTISNCSIYDTRLAGVALEIVDGGVMDGIVVSGLQMRNVQCPLFVRLGNRARPFREAGPQPGQGQLRNVMLQGIQATGAGKTGCSLTGLPDAPIENIVLRDIALSFTGGGTAEDARRAIAEVPDKYPEYAMFGTLPAYGLYVRHARSVSIDNLRTSYAADDLRPALVADDVERLRLAGLDPQAHAEAAAAVRLVDAREAYLHGNHLRGWAKVFLRLEGARTAGVQMGANALADFVRAADLGPEVRKSALRR